MKGLAFLDKALFTTFNFFAPAQDRHENDSDDEDNDVPAAPTFQISLSALLETLQIFGASENRDRLSRETTALNDPILRNGASGPFDSRALGLSGMCRIQYESVGSPLCITLEEGNVTTTCTLTTYEPEYAGDIPFDREHLSQKIIMRSAWLHDAMSELNSTSPDRASITASPHPPYFSLSATGALGSATVDFAKEAQLLETYQVPRLVSNSYKFSFLKAAGRAMATAAKVSIRGDEQGVLSLQFMIEVESGSVSFVDFRIVPFVEEEEGQGERNDDSESDG